MFSAATQRKTRVSCRFAGGPQCVVCDSCSSSGSSLLLPAVARAQSLAGVAKDTSGAVLPGVTVEAASPALIEKVRSVTTDTSGQYKIVDLRPGTYTVTFTLTGFSVVKREGIELGGSGTVTVNARHEGRHAGRDDHGDRRDADRGRAERRAPAGARRQSRREHAGGEELERHHAARARRDGRPEHRAAHTRDGAVRHSRRSGHGRPSAGGRHERRRVARRRRRVRVLRRHGERAGSHVPHVGRPGRGGNRRAVHEHRAEDGRQHVQGNGRRSSSRIRRCRATTTTTFCEAS